MTAKKSFEELLNANLPTTPIMMDNPADMYRPSFVFERGNWLVKGKEVHPCCATRIKSAYLREHPLTGWDWPCG